MKMDLGHWQVAESVCKLADRPLAIEARGLVKRFDGFTAVDGIDISVPEGAIYGILGPNGAGKTTTLRMLLGIIDPDEGERRVLGAARPHDVAHAIGYLPEERGLYPSMKAYEAIGFVGALRGLPLAEGRKRGRELLEEHGLGYAAERQIRQMSKGMAQQVQILGTLVHEPRLVVFDEPFSGLDAINQGRLERMIRTLAEKGTTVIFPPMSSPMPNGCATKWRSLPAAGFLSQARSTSRVIAFARKCGSKPVPATDRGARRCLTTRGARAGSGISPCPKAGSSRCCAR